MTDLVRYREAALAIVSECRTLIQAREHEGFASRRKRDSSFVTDVDLEVESMVRDRIRNLFPDHGFIGEEYESDNVQRSHTWVVDPIDGTRSFVAGVPLYGTLIALIIDGEPTLGVIDHPAMNTCYHAARGLGAFAGAQQLTLQDSQLGANVEIIATGERRQFVAAGWETWFDRLMREHPHLRTYCDCFGHSLAARGAVGAMVDPALKLWDYAASQVLIEEAGGTFDAQPTTGDASRRNIIMGKPSVVRWLLDHQRARGTSSNEK